MFWLREGFISLERTLASPVFWLVSIGCDLPPQSRLPPMATCMSRAVLAGVFVVRTRSRDSWSQEAGQRRERGLLTKAALFFSHNRIKCDHELISHALPL